MSKHLFLLALAVACGSNSPSDDDDSSGGGSGDTLTGGSAGKASGGSGGARTGGAAGMLTLPAGASGSSGVSGGASSGAPGVGGVSGTSAAGAGGTLPIAGVGQGATGGEAGAGAGAGGEDFGGMGGVGAEAGEGTLNGGEVGNGGTGGLTGGTGGTGGSTGGTGGTGGSTGGTGGMGGVASGGKAGYGGWFGYSGEGGQTSGAGLPLVELLVDGSSSMFEDQTWDAMMRSLIDDGVLVAFEGQLNLGLGVFQGAHASSESDPTCSTWAAEPFAGSNGNEIGNDLAAVGNSWAYQKWETPTGHAIGVAAQTLDATSVEPGVKKYILLVTDGAPNTCVVTDPQCGQDMAIKAVQDAHALGIRTLIVGLGDLIAGSDGCVSSAHCGDAHLQDIANAGVGYPVEPMSDSYRYEACVQSHVLLASYASIGGGGGATYYSSNKTGGLTGQLTAAFQAIVNDTVP